MNQVSHHWVYFQTHKSFQPHLISPKHYPYEAGLVEQRSKQTQCECKICVLSSSSTRHHSIDSSVVTLAVEIDLFKPIAVVSQLTEQLSLLSLTFQQQQRWSLSVRLAQHQTAGGQLVSFHRHMKPLCCLCFPGELDGLTRGRSTEKPAICRPPVRPPEPPSRNPAPQKPQCAASGETTPTS